MWAYILSSAWLAIDTHMALAATDLFVATFAAVFTHKVWPWE